MSEDQMSDAELDAFLARANEQLIDGLPDGMSAEEFRATLARLNARPSYPIEPGSALDAALNDIVAWGASQPQHLDGIRAQLALLDRDNPAHRLALGTRLHLHRLGIRDPHTLVERLYARWYGEAR